jgi:hypothetical protein
MGCLDPILGGVVSSKGSMIAASSPNHFRHSPYASASLRENRASAS